MTNCDLSLQLASYFNVFIAYNPKNNKVYVADIRSGTETKIWLLDIGLPANIICPASIPTDPTYSYSYVSNNFEFDNNGDLWSFSNYSSSTGQCSVDKFDVNTGAVMSSKVIQFPDGNFPTTISSGDITILPNGRMFTVLGNSTCRLYEIINYNTAGGIATAIYLRTLPKDCYGIAYLNGQLELTGMNFNGSCYYYDYNIAANILGTEKPFQNGQAPIDNTSFTSSVGCTKRLLNATKINANTADLVYEIYQENLGNVVLNNVNLTDNLGEGFGAANVSNVSVSFVPGSNAAGLTLNPYYNGTSVTNILNSGQNLPNKVLANRDYFFKLQISCRVTNLNMSTTYFNTAIASGENGSGNLSTQINVSDSSNNGDTTVIDPNKNGNAGDFGENVPTPFVFSLLPVKFLSINAALINSNTAQINWHVATPMLNAVKFDVEYSQDGKNWTTAGSVMTIDNYQSGYSFSHINISHGNLFYRIRQIDEDGTFIYSKIVVLQNKNKGNSYMIYPNPAGDNITVSSVHLLVEKANIEMYDGIGRKLFVRKMGNTLEEINVSTYPTGAYFLKIFFDGNVEIHKINIQH